jgi:Flp pilus assembly protein TadD
LQALKKNPDDFQLLVAVAQVLATDENPNARDGRTALELANKASTLAGSEEPTVLDALAMAYAELGRFDDAQKAGRDALRLYTVNGQTNEAALMRQKLQFYQDHQPFRQSFASGQPPK